jgi:hypothetical protein
MENYRQVGKGPTVEGKYLGWKLILLSKKSLQEGNDHLSRKNCKKWEIIPLTRAKAFRKPLTDHVGRKYTSRRERSLKLRSDSAQKDMNPVKGQLFVSAAGLF